MLYTTHSDIAANFCNFTPNMSNISKTTISSKCQKPTIFIKRFLKKWMHHIRSRYWYIKVRHRLQRKCYGFVPLFNQIKYIAVHIYCILDYYLGKKCTQMAKITWPVSMATKGRNREFDITFQVFTPKDISCENFIKIGDMPCRPHIVNGVIFTENCY